MHAHTHIMADYVAQAPLMALECYPQTIHQVIPRMWITQWIIPIIIPKMWITYFFIHICAPSVS